MNVAQFLGFALLALADLALLAHLRAIRRRQKREDRMMQALSVAIQRDLTWTSTKARLTRASLRRAS